MNIQEVVDSIVQSFNDASYNANVVNKKENGDLTTVDLLLNNRKPITVSVYEGKLFLNDFTGQQLLGDLGTKEVVKSIIAAMK